jgi:hypothetical protein
MGSARTTRARRPQLCAVCLRQRRRPGLTTCATCGNRSARHSRDRYQAARGAQRCTRSGCDERGELDRATGRRAHLCTAHGQARRTARTS